MANFGGFLKEYSIARKLRVLAFLLVSSQVLAQPPKCEAIHKKIHKVVSLEQSVERLKDNGTIAPEIYDEFSVNDIARAIVKRVENYEKKHPLLVEEPGQVKVDLQKSSDIIIFFHVQDAESIGKKGFLNQHLTKKSSGYFGPPTRRKAEDVFTGVQMGASESALKLRPKSAFLNLRVKKSLGEKSYPVSIAYGKFAAVLKEEVKQRAMWTAGDSLSFGGWGKAAMSSSELALSRGSFTSQRFKAEHGAYAEAIIYGEFDFNDVEYFLVAPTHVDDSNIKFLKKTGKDIFVLEEKKEFNRYVYYPKKKLYQGKTIKDAKAPGVLLHEAALEAAGIKATVKKQKKAVLDREEFVVDQLETDKAEYFLYSPKEDATAFSDFASELRGALDTLSNNKIKTKKILHDTDEFILQAGPGKDVDLSDLSAIKKKTVLPGLKKLLSKLVKERLYVSGLRPSYLMMDAKGNLIVKTVDALSKKKSTKESANRFREKVLSHWQGYFAPKELSELKSFLATLG